MARTTKAQFDDIAGKARACRLCVKHLPVGPRPVFQIGSNAKILIAGQAPGRRVHETGIPFNDPSGERLRSWMGIDAAVFYDPRKIAILPMGFCYPGRGKSGDLPPRPECAAEWRVRLLKLLPAVELTLPLPHPSPRNNIWLKKNPWFEAEILPKLQRKIRSLLNG